MSVASPTNEFIDYNKISSYVNSWIRGPTTTSSLKSSTSNRRTEFADHIQRVFYDVKNEQIEHPTTRSAEARGKSLRKVLDDYALSLESDNQTDSVIPRVYLDGLYLTVSALQENPTLFNDVTVTNQFLTEVNAIRQNALGPLTKSQLRHALPVFIQEYSTFSYHYHQVNELVHRTSQVPPLVVRDVLLPGMCLYPLKQKIPNHVITSVTNFHRGLDALNEMDRLLTTIRKDISVRG